MVNRIERAKQFMPFASLRGYYDLVQEASTIQEPKHELCEDDGETLSRQLCHLQKGDHVNVHYYRQNCYQNLDGIVERIDLLLHTITISHTVIAFSDLYKITIF